MKVNYRYNITGYDWGCAVSSILLTFEKPLDNLKKDDFEVIETTQATDYSQLTFPIETIQQKRLIKDAYFCNQQGLPVESSNCVLLTLDVNPTTNGPIIFSMHTQQNTWADPYQLTITHPMIDEVDKIERVTSVDELLSHEFISSSNITYHCLKHVPKEKSDTLLVWLHGLGEGGRLEEKTTPEIVCLANKASVFITKDFQDIVGDIHVLYPQCPTYWMDLDGKKTNFNNGEIVTDTHSFYKESLKECIDDYKKTYNIKKVVLAGCSNGGYMCMVMGIHYPDDFDAIVPICEALPDCTISNEQLRCIKDLPMYFIYCTSDPIVKPELHEIPTLKRLKEMNATDLSVGTVPVLENKDFLVDGKPFVYNGHWSWIYFYNNYWKTFEWIKKHI